MVLLIVAVLLGLGLAVFTVAACMLSSAISAREREP